MPDVKSIGPLFEQFDGETYSPELDGERLRGQLRDVFKLMTDGQWRTLGEIQESIGRGSEAGISARLRDLRKRQFGCHHVDRRRRIGGLYEYRMEVGSGRVSGYNRRECSDQGMD